MILFILMKMPTYLLYNTIMRNAKKKVLASSAVDRGIEPRSGQSKYYKIGICWFSTKHVALRRKSEDWLARNHNNVLSGATCLSADCCFSELAL